MYGWSEEEALGMNVFDLMIPESKREETVSVYKRLAMGESIPSYETQMMTRDGRTLDVWATLTVIVNDASQPVGVASTVRDITERRHSLLRLSFGNRALKAANLWYKTLLAGTGPAVNLEEACRILVEDAGYCLAWIGWVEQNNSRAVTPVTWAGVENGNPLPADSLRSLARLSQAPVESALFSGHPVAVRNILNNPAQAQWRAEGQKYGFGSLIALPLITGKDPLGILVIFATDPESFEEQEVKELETLSESIVRAAAPGKNRDQQAGILRKE